MPHVRVRVALGVLALAAVLVVASGCQPAGPLERVGIALAPPAAWKPVKPSTWMVPGVALAAWAGPDGSSLVLYRTPWVPGGSAEMLAEALANRLENLPELRLVARRTETAGGMMAARVEVVAPGTGDALAASGMGAPIAPSGNPLVATHQVVLGFPRPVATLYLAWHVPESSYNRIAPEIQATIDSVRFTSGGRALSRQH